MEGAAVGDSVTEDGAGSEVSSSEEEGVELLSAVGEPDSLQRRNG